MSSIYKLPERIEEINHLLKSIDMSLKFVLIALGIIVGLLFPVKKVFANTVPTLSQQPKYTTLLYCKQKQIIDANGNKITVQYCHATNGKNYIR